MQNIVEKAYNITKELAEKKNTSFVNNKNIQCQMAIIEYEKDEEYEEHETYITYTDGHNRVQMKNVGPLNPGLLHSFIVGLLRNL